MSCYGCQSLAQRIELNEATIADLQRQVAHLTKERDVQKEVIDNQAWWVRKLRPEVDALQQRVAQLEGERDEANALPNLQRVDGG